MSRDLPKGWNKARIADIATTQSGGTPSTGKKEYWDNGTIPWINSGALRDEVISAPSTLITRLGLENSSAKLFPKNTVVIALTGATTGRVGLLGLETSTNQSVTGIFPSTFFVPEYLFYYLRSERKFVIEQAIGSAQPHINKQIVDDLEVPLAPLAEQKRIVAKVEKLLAKVDASRARLERVSALLKRFRQSVLAAACSGRLTADWRIKYPDVRVSEPLRGKTVHTDNIIDLPPSWMPCCVGTVMQLKNGFAFKSTDYCDSGVPLVRISNIQDGKVILEDSAKLPPEKANWNFVVERGDLLVAMSGATTGKFGTYDGNERCLQNQRVGNIKVLDTEEVIPGYRNLYLQSLQKRIEEDAYGGAQPNISPSKIEALPFACPPLPEQKEIVRRVEELFALADRLEARVGKARGQVDKLTQAILAKAFRGELVPQDPNDEPAEKLLARIRAATGPIAVQGGKVAASVSVRRGRPRKVR